MVGFHCASGTDGHGQPLARDRTCWGRPNDNMKLAARHVSHAGIFGVRIRGNIWRVNSVRRATSLKGGDLSGPGTPSDGDEHGLATTFKPGTDCAARPAGWSMPEVREADGPLCRVVRFYRYRSMTPNRIRGGFTEPPRDGQPVSRGPALVHRVTSAFSPRPLPGNGRPSRNPSPAASGPAPMTDPVPCG